MLKQRFPGSNNPTRRRIGEAGVMNIADARDVAREWLAQLQRGIDPADELAEQKRLAAQERSQQQATSFAVVAEEYIARRLTKQRRGGVATQAFRSELLPIWGDRRLNEITRRDVVKLIEGVIDRPRSAQRATVGRSGAYARNVLNHIRSFFNWCIARDIYGVTISPCSGIKPKDLIGPAKVRERVLDDAELQALMRAANDIGYPFGNLVEMLVLTGARKSEVSGARWSEFHSATKTWTVPAARYKTGASHTIPLTDDLIALLDDLPRFQHGDLLFSTTFGRKPFNGFSKAKARLDRLMGERLGELRPWCLHDLRRTMRTRLAELRIPDHIAEAAIGHAKRGIVAVYNKARYADELREAFETWHAKLRTIVTRRRRTSWLCVTKSECEVKDAGRDWDALMDKYWGDKRRDSDERWGAALELLHQFRNPDGVIALLAAGAPVPDWAREEIAAWRAGQRPRLPTMKDDDWKLLAAVRAYRDKASRRPNEKRDDRIKRIADEHKISATALENFVNCEGGTYKRLVKDWQGWERIYSAAYRSKQ